jgi:hypothetical protein
MEIKMQSDVQFALNMCSSWLQWNFDLCTDASVPATLTFPREIL